MPARVRGNARGTNSPVVLGIKIGEGEWNYYIRGCPSGNDEALTRSNIRGLGRVRTLNFANVTELLQPNGRHGRTGRPEQDLP